MRTLLVSIFFFAAAACAPAPSDNAQPSSTTGKADGVEDDTLGKDQCPGHPYRCSQAAIEGAQDSCDRACSANGQYSLGIKYCWSRVADGSGERPDGGSAPNLCAPCACGGTPNPVDFAYYPDLGSP